MHAFPAALLAAAFASTAMAQVPVTVRCTPTDGSAAGCYYCPGYETVIKWVGTKMNCATINLVAYHNQDVMVQGTWNGLVIEVTSVQVVPESFSISGAVTIGDACDFQTSGTDGDLAINLAALGNGFAVPFLDLALQLNPSSMVILDAGVISGGEYESTLAIPSVPSLIGLRLYGQGVVMQPNFQLYTTNIDTKVVS